jgi:hypothetical protein
VSKPLSRLPLVAALPSPAKAWGSDWFDSVPDDASRTSQAEVETVVGTARHGQPLRDPRARCDIDRQIGWRALARLANLHIEL